jgi:hypothetical protein
MKNFSFCINFCKKFFFMKVFTNFFFEMFFCKYFCGLEVFRRKRIFLNNIPSVFRICILIQLTPGSGSAFRMENFRENFRENFNVCCKEFTIYIDTEKHKKV